MARIKDTTNIYLNEIDKIPSLSREEEKTVSDKIKSGDRQALSRLVKSNLKFVVFIAKEYQDKGLPLEELISEGNLGLIEAARRFDANRGIKFISYAVWWIRQSILRALANHSRLVRLPINHVWSLQKVINTLELLEQDLGRPPEMEEVAKELNISPTKLFKDLSYWGKEVSLDDSNGLDEDSQPLIDRVRSDEFLPPNSVLLQESLDYEIKAALDSLNPDEAQVLRLYYGIGQERQLTLLEIGNMMNLSRERIRQIKNKALRKLRYIHRREKLQPYLE
ncbi:RNA polymerase sigma factor RpoD/SigA [candidate division KSB1 bacterium]|nr:RNA polymerase sigma factor RpoD/SigA [candidate division KSB1 bacterium]